jgi:hypothetical protein
LFKAVPPRRNGHLSDNVPRPATSTVQQTRRPQGYWRETAAPMLGYRAASTHADKLKSYCPPRPSLSTRSPQQTQPRSSGSQKCCLVGALFGPSVRPATSLRPRGVQRAGHRPRPSKAGSVHGHFVHFVHLSVGGAPEARTTHSRAAQPVRQRLVLRSVMAMDGMT